MLDPKFITENWEEVYYKTAAKNVNPEYVDKFVILDVQKQNYRRLVQNLQTQRNKFAKEKNVVCGKCIKERLQKTKPELADIERKWKEVLFTIPNLPVSDTLISKRAIEKWFPGLYDIYQGMTVGDFWNEIKGRRMVENG